MIDGSGLWFDAAGFVVLDVSVVEGELVVAVETAQGWSACAECGTPAAAKDRRWVTLRDTPVAGRPTRVRWRKRVWACPDPDCEVRTWTEQAGLAGPRRLLTDRAAVWATDRLAAVEATVAGLARGFGVSWATVWSAVTEVAHGRVDDPARVGPTVMVGFDETVMQPAHRRRRRRLITAVVDIETSQILDVFEGRDARHLRAWLAGRPGWWLEGVQVVSVDPHEGYRSAVVRPDPATGRCAFGDVSVVVDPFHVVRLANQAVTRCRQRTQRDLLEHRGWKGDPLYDARKLLLIGGERLDPAGWDRLCAALDRGDPDGQVWDCWVAKEKVRDVYRTDDPTLAAVRVDDAIRWCTAAGSGPELARLVKVLRRWRTEIVAHHVTGASNGPVEAANLLIKQIKRSGRGFRNLANYRLRILLAGGTPRRQTPTVASIRTRRPRLVA